MLAASVSKILMMPGAVYPLLRVARQGDRGREFQHGSPYHHTLIKVRACLNASKLQTYEDNSHCDWVSGTCYGWTGTSGRLTKSSAFTIKHEQMTTNMNKYCGTSPRIIGSLYDAPNRGSYG